VKTWALALFVIKNNIRNKLKKELVKIVYSFFNLMEEIVGFAVKF
jgi:hypothetical protein